MNRGILQVSSIDLLQLRNGEKEVKTETKSSKGWLWSQIAILVCIGVQVGKLIAMVGKLLVIVTNETPEVKRGNKQSKSMR